MTKRAEFVLAVSVATTGLVVSSAAWAGAVVAHPVPEPGLFGIVVAGMAGVIIAARLTRKSK